MRLILIRIKWCCPESVWFFSNLTARLFIFFIFGIIFTAPAPSDAAEKKLALVIGNSAYQRVPALPNPQNDAMAIADGLKNIGFDVILLLNATAVQQKNAVTVFIERMSNNDVGLFYYAGHGISINSQNYLIPVDARISSAKSVERELLRVDRALNIPLNQRKLLVFLDACRDNPFVNQISQIKNIEVSRGLAKMRSIKIKDTQSNQGLSRVGSGSQNLFVAFATQPGNVALDGLNGEKHSPFSKGVIQYLEDRLEIRELMTKVRAAVAQNTQYMQIPWEQNSLLEPVYIAGKPDLGKMEIFHVANVSKVNRSWGFVVADLVSDRKPEVGDFLSIELGAKTIEAKVGKVMKSAVSLIPTTWDIAIPPGSKVIEKEFTQK